MVVCDYYALLEDYPIQNTYIVQKQDCASGMTDTIHPKTSQCKSY